MNKKYVFASIASLILLLGSNVQADTWTGPTATPPSATVSVPVNLSNLSQTKAGGLILNSGGAEYGLLIPYGKVGIGTITPGGLFDVFGSSGSAFTVLSNGNVGVGVTAPSSRLSIAGGVQVGTDTATCDTTKAGTIRWQGGALEVCSGSAWVGVSSVGSVGAMSGFCGFTYRDRPYAPYPGDPNAEPVRTCETGDGLAVAPAWCDPSPNAAPYGCGCATGYTLTKKKDLSIETGYAPYAPNSHYYAYTCVKANSNPAGPSCPVTGVCPAGVEGAKCSSYSSAYSSNVQSEVCNQYSDGRCIGYTTTYASCSTIETISTCSGGAWTPTPLASRTCIRGADPTPPPSAPACDAQCQCANDGGHWNGAWGCEFYNTNPNPDPEPEPDPNAYDEYQCNMDGGSWNDGQCEH